MRGGGEEINLFAVMVVFKKCTFLLSWLFFKTLHVSGISAANAAIITLN